MRILDLFSGLEGWSQAFRERGHEVCTVDIDPRFEPTVIADILELGPGDLPWRPDIIVASPPCEAFSVMTFGHYWAPGRVPKGPKAELAMALVEATCRLIRELQPTYWVVENPRAMLRTLPMLADVERLTVTYCQYGLPYMKPTDLWGGFPPAWVPRPVCRPRAPCHESAPRGARTGVQGVGYLGMHPVTLRQKRAGEYGRTLKYLVGEAALAAERARVPYELGLEICLAAEEGLANGGEQASLALWSWAHG